MLLDLEMSVSSKKEMLQDRKEQTETPPPWRFLFLLSHWSKTDAKKGRAYDFNICP